MLACGNSFCLSPCGWNMKGVVRCPCFHALPFPSMWEHHLSRLPQTLSDNSCVCNQVSGMWLSFALIYLLPWMSFLPSCFWRGAEVWVYVLRRTTNRNRKCVWVSAKSLFLLLLLTRLILCASPSFSAVMLLPGICSIFQGVWLCLPSEMQDGVIRALFWMKSRSSCLVILVR